MSINQTSLLEGERGHRRGVVLGLTMAEIMLLLLFCLLLVAASLLAQRDEQIEQLQEQVIDLGAEPVVIEEVGPVSARPSADDITTQLAEARDTIDEQSAELTLLREFERQAGEAFPQVNKKITPDTWRELVMAEEAGRQIMESGATLEELETAIEEIRVQENLVAGIDPSSSGNDWPPMIQLGSGEFRFILNSAELSPDFRTALQVQVSGQILELLSEYGADVVEVVGHTDELRITTVNQSTLDDLAIGAMAGTVAVNQLIPADNAGLGLARAISVANALRELINDSDVKVIPMSAGQLVKPGDEVSDGISPFNDPNRRRIEIRVRRSDTGEAQ